MKISRIVHITVCFIVIPILAYILSQQQNCNFGKILELPFTIVNREDIIIEGGGAKTRKIIKQIISGEHDIANDSCNIKKIYKKVISLPWVERLEMRIAYPSKCIMRISEEKPYAVYYKDTKLYLISKEGKILDQVKNSSGYVIFSGANANNVGHYIIDELSKFQGLLDNVSEIMLRNNRRWDIILGDTLVLLPEININDAIESLYGIFFKNGKFKQFSKIDLRIHGKAYTSPREMR